MKISIDFHGVIDSLPDFFSFLTKAFINNGGEVHIVTGGSWTKELENQLKDFGIVWTNHFSVYDFLIEKNIPTSGEVVFSDGTIQKKFDNNLWDHIKAEYCEKNKINFHIDDTLAYNEFFKTPFARLWTHNNKPKASHKDVRHLD